MHVPGLGTKTGSTVLFSTTARFCDIRQRRNCSFLTSSHCYNKLNDLIVESLVRDGSHIFNDIHSWGYMEVSSETSDTPICIRDHIAIYIYTCRRLMCLI